jgi:hypothetical protein
MLDDSDNIVQLCEEFETETERDLVKLQDEVKKLKVATNAKERRVRCRFRTVNATQPRAGSTSGDDLCGFRHPSSKGCVAQPDLFSTETGCFV